eukprot:scaffold21455_cov116-Cylindrotheca_fusiformis.AAC.2
MAGNRRNRGSHASAHTQPPHRRTSSDTTPSSHFKRSQAKNSSIVQHNDVLLAEIEEGLNISWKDIGTCGMNLLFLTMIGIIVGIVAGMTISIHYFEKSVVTGDSVAASSSPSSTQGKRGLLNSHVERVTMFDPEILGSNSLTQRKEHSNQHQLDLGTVLTATESGQLDVLYVVDEAAPLSGESPQPSSLDSQEDSSNDTSDNSSTSTTTSRQMSLEEANMLVPNYTDWLDSQPNIYIREPTIHPIACKDGSFGFDEWNMLKAAVQEANSISAERFMKWSSYFASLGNQFVAFHNDHLYYEEDVIFHICPGAKLQARRGPIFLNAENVVIECNTYDCTINVGGTHLAFGPHAKNVLVKGVTFRGARSSSLTFFHDGAEATFEDCRWIGNSGANSKFGSVADINSTSLVNFHRCEISDTKSGGWFGGAEPPGKASSLSIRT